MEKNKVGKEKIIKDYILEIGLENPSEKFTENIMGKLIPETRYSAASYKPVIGKKTWIFISLIIILSSIILIIFAPSSEENILEKLGISIDLESVFDKFLLFTESLFQNLNIPIALLIGMSAIVILAIADKYLKKLIWFNKL